MSVQFFLPFFPFPLNFHCPCLPHSSLSDSLVYFSSFLILLPFFPASYVSLPLSLLLRHSLPSCLFPFLPVSIMPSLHPVLFPTLPPPVSFSPFLVPSLPPKLTSLPTSQPSYVPPPLQSYVEVHLQDLTCAVCLFQLAEPWFSKVPHKTQVLDDELLSLMNLNL